MDHRDKPVISIPWPTRQKIVVGLILGSISAYLAAIVVVLLRQPPATDSHRWIYIIECSVLCPLPLVLLGFAIRRPMFAVGHNGMTVEKVRVR